MTIVHLFTCQYFFFRWASLFLNKFSSLLVTILSNIFNNFLPFSIYILWKCYVSFTFRIVHNKFFGLVKKEGRKRKKIRKSTFWEKCLALHTHISKLMHLHFHCFPIRHTSLSLFLTFSLLLAFPLSPFFFFFFIFACFLSPTFFSKPKKLEGKRLLAFYFLFRDELWPLFLLFLSPSLIHSNTSFPLTHSYSFSKQSPSLSLWKSVAKQKCHSQKYSKQRKRGRERENFGWASQCSTSLLAWTNESVNQ